MSYCRFSSDDYQCDVYVYLSDEGYITHTAHRRFVFDVPLPEPVVLGPNRTDKEFKAWFDRKMKVSEWHDDETKGHWVKVPKAESDCFQHNTPGECADNLERLRSLGLNVPQRAIDALREEATEDEAMQQRQEV